MNNIIQSPEFSGGQNGSDKRSDMSNHTYSLVAYDMNGKQWRLGTYHNNQTALQALNDAFYSGLYQQILIRTNIN